MRKDLIAKYISEAAKHLIKVNHESYRDVSQKLNISYGFFRQLMSNNRDLTIADVYEISRLENEPVDYMFPPIQNSTKGFKKYKTVTGNTSKADFKRFMEQINI